MAASLTVEPIHGLGAGARMVSVDCRHSEARVTVLPGHNGPPIDMATVGRLAVERQFAEEGCRCTAILRRRYPAAGTDSDGG